MAQSDAPLLEIRGLRANIDDREILKGVELAVNAGEIHALMGPNGSGKSTLAKVVAGHPSYKVTAGEVLFRGEDVLAMSPDERARKGVFLAFQYPLEIPGVPVRQFLRLAANARRGEDMDILDFADLLDAKMAMLGMDPAFADRALNEGFSGGEKKRNEILQMALLEPRLALLDETDSGLDIDALKIVSKGVNTVMSERAGEMGVLLITHYQRILNYITPDVVHVFMNGRVVRTGGRELALTLEERGYDWLREVESAGAGV